MTLEGQAAEATTNGASNGAPATIGNGLSMDKIRSIVAERTKSAEKAATGDDTTKASGDTKATNGDAAVKDEKPADGGAEAKPEPKKDEAKTEGKDKEKPKEKNQTDEINSRWASLTRAEKSFKDKQQAHEAEVTKVAEREKAVAAKEAEYAELVRLAKENPHLWWEKAGVSLRKGIEDTVAFRKQEAEDEAKLTPEQKELREIKRQMKERDEREAKERADADSKRKADEEAAKAREAEQSEEDEKAARKQVFDENQAAFKKTLSEDTDYPTLHSHLSPAEVAEQAVELEVEHYRAYVEQHGSGKGHQRMTKEEIFEELERRAVRALDRLNGTEETDDYAGRRAQFLAKQGKTTDRSNADGGGQGRDKPGSVGNGHDAPAGNRSAKTITNATSVQRSVADPAPSIVGDRAAAAARLKAARVLT